MKQSLEDQTCLKAIIWLLVFTVKGNCRRFFGSDNCAIGRRDAIGADYRGTLAPAQDQQYERTGTYNEADHLRG
jgi:hypothetical protein